MGGGASGNLQTRLTSATATKVVMCATQRKVGETSRSSRMILLPNSQKWEPTAFPVQEVAPSLALVYKGSQETGA